MQGGQGGTQIEGGNPGLCYDNNICGYKGEFGQGANYINKSDCINSTHCGEKAGAGGGGGYYGGGSSMHEGAGGGSGYIGNQYLTDKVMYCYNCQESNDDNTKTISTTNVSSNPTINYAKQDDGFAKITFIEEIPEYTFDYTGDAQEFIAPYNGIYKVELWGASGTDSEKETGGKGSYSEGYITLTKNKKIYVYVGNNENSSKTVYNGGSKFTSFDSKDENGIQKVYPGGGATDIRLTPGTWDNFDSLKSRLMVASGGGGAGYCEGTSQYYGSGGAAGGLIGYDGYSTSFSNIFSGKGATQLSGGRFTSTISQNDEYHGEFGKQASSANEL